MAEKRAAAASRGSEAVEETKEAKDAEPDAMADFLEDDWTVWSVGLRVVLTPVAVGLDAVLLLSGGMSGRL